MGLRNEQVTNINIWKRAHLHQSLEKPKSKLHRDSILPQSEVSWKENKQCECGLKGALTCWWEYKLVQSLWKLVWRALKKLEVGLPSGPAIPLVGIYPKTPRQHDCRDGYPSTFIAAQFTVVQLWNQPRCSSREKWLRKMWYIYTMEFF